MPYYGATGQAGWIDNPIFNEELLLLGEDGAPFLDPAKRKAYIIDGPAWVNNHAHVLRAITDLATNKFLKYQLDWMPYEGRVTGTTRLKLTQRVMRQLPILLPGVGGQARIVAAIEEHFSRLDAASDAITAARARIEATRRSVLVAALAGWLAPQDPADEPASDLMSRIAGGGPAKSVAQRTQRSLRSVTDLLPPGWVWARFDEVAETQLGKMLSVKSRQGKAPVPYLRNQNVQWHRIDLSDVASMDFTDNERVKYQLRPGDLLICEGGEVGRAAMWTQPSVEMCFQKALHRVRARPGIEARWIEYFMRWSAQTGRFEEHAQGSTIAHLPQRDLRALMVPIPPTKEQRRIVAAIEEYLSRLDAASDAMTVARARIEATRRSVLVEAFTGRLTRQDRPMNQRKI